MYQIQEEGQISEAVANDAGPSAARALGDEGECHARDRALDFRLLFFVLAHLHG